MKNSEEEHKIIPFLVIYTPPSKVTIKAIYYYDPQLEIVLPLLKKSFPEDVAVEYHELTDRFDYEAWITIDWTGHQFDIWPDNHEVLEQGVLKVLREYVEKEF